MVCGEELNVRAFDAGPLRLFEDQGRQRICVLASAATRIPYSNLLRFFSDCGHQRWDHVITKSLEQLRVSEKGIWHG